MQRVARRHIERRQAGRHCADRGYTKETHEAKLGPIELSVKDKRTVNIPVWAGVGAIVIGGALLLFGGKKS